MSKIIIMQEPGYTLKSACINLFVTHCNSLFTVMPSSSSTKSIMPYTSAASTTNCLLPNDVFCPFKKK